MDANGEDFGNGHDNGMDTSTDASTVSPFVETDGPLSNNTQLTAPVLSVNDEQPEIDPKNVMRSPPKLLPAVPIPELNEDSSRSTVKLLTGSMKNTPASLSIIDVPTSLSGKSTRSTRSSIDPSFAAKQRSFLHKVHNALSSTRIEDTSSCDSDGEAAMEDNSNDSTEYSRNISPSKRHISISSVLKRRREDSTSQRESSDCNGESRYQTDNSENIESYSPATKKPCVPIEKSDGKLGDAFCWYCHREETTFLTCTSCPRVFHSRCLRRPASTSDSVGDWVCPECVTILRAENLETRSKALRMLSLDQLCDLLQFAVDRMKSCPGAEVFIPPVDTNEFPSYKNYIVNPMHLSLLEKNIKRRMYGSTEAFVADATWIVHNCVIFNSYQSKLTSVAKNILKICKQEMSEIENCPDCYKHAYSCEDNWFIRVCRKPHLLVWAKLKGFPFWPAKAMRINSDGAVDVRFFGAHDRSWVPARECFLYSQENPNNSTSNKPPQSMQSRKRSPKNNLETCIEEVELHIQQLREEFEEFCYAPARTPLLPKKMNEQLKILLPQYKPIEGLAVNKEHNHSLLKCIKKEGLSQKSTEPSIAKQVLHEHKNLNNSTTDLSIKKITQGVGKIIDPDQVLTTSSIIHTPLDSTNCFPEASSVKSETQTQSTISRNTVNKTPCSVAPSAVKIAEQRLKKKDARKIGLVDRLQEKLSQWLSPGLGDKQKEGINSQSRTSPDTSSNKTSLEHQTEKSNVQEMEVEPLETNDELVSHNISTTSESHNESLDTCDSDESIQLQKQLLLYKMSKCQPKVMLQKLVLPVADAVKGTSPSDSTNYRSEEDEISEDNLNDENVLPDFADHKGRGISSSPEVVVECVIERVSDSEGSTVQSKASADCMQMAAAVDSLKSEETASVVSDKITDVFHNKLNSSSENDTLCSGDKTRDLVPPDKKARLVRVLTPEALGIKPSAFNKNHQSPDLLMKSRTANNSSTFTTLIPVHQSVSICVNKSGTPSQDNGFKSSELQENIRGSDVSLRLDQCSGENEVNERHVIEIPVISCPSSMLTSTASSTATQKAATASENLVESKPSSHTSIPVSGALGLSQASDKTSPGAITLTKIKPGDGRVGNLVLGQVNKVIQIPPQGSSTAQSVPGTLTSVNSTLVSGSPTPSATKKTTVGTASSSTRSVPMVPTQISSLTKPLIVPPSTPSPVSRTLSLSTSKKAAIVTVSSGTASVPVPLVRRILPKAIALSPNSVLVTNRSNNRISVGPLPSQSAMLTTHLPGSSETSIIPVSSACNSNTNLTSSVTAQPPKSHLLQAVGLVSTEGASRTVNETESVVPIKQVLPFTPGKSVDSCENGLSPLEKEKVSASFRPRTVSNEKKSTYRWLQSSGSATTFLQSKAAKLSDMFMNCLDEYLHDMSRGGNLEAQVRCLQLDLEHLQWRHKQEMDELRHNTELLISEIRDSLKVEAQRAVTEALKSAKVEKDEAIAATKQKQWCAFCGKEALFYCCWNTSYCDYKCQENHWPAHSLTCMQGRNSGEDRLAGKVDGKGSEERRRRHSHESSGIS